MKHSINEKKTNFGKLAAVLAVIAMALAISCSVLSDVQTSSSGEVEDAESAMEQAKAAYLASVDALEEAQSAHSAAIEDVERQKVVVEDDKRKASKAAKALYVESLDKWGILADVVASSSDLTDAFERVEFLDRIYKSQGDALAQAEASMNALVEKERHLNETAEQAAVKKDEMNAAMQEALALYEQAKENEAARKAAEEAARQAAYDDGGSYTHNWVTGEVESEVTVSVDEMLFLGVVVANGWKYTYYQESILPGDGLDIPGRHHEGSMVVDEDGYICVASSTVPKHTVVPTPLGRPGKVYDTGCARGVVDLYLI